MGQEFCWKNCYPVGTIGTGQAREKNKNKVMTKYEHLIQNKMQDFKNAIFSKNQNSTLSLHMKWEVCERAHFLVCPAKGRIGV
jgi:hypothetical protein